MSRDFHPAVYDFIERIFLHLALLTEPSKKEDLLRQDRLTLSVNGVDYGKAKVDFCSVLEAVDLKYPFSLSADSSFPCFLAGSGHEDRSGISETV